MLYVVELDDLEAKLVYMAVLMLWEQRIEHDKFKKEIPEPDVERIEQLVQRLERFVPVLETE